MLTPIPPQEIRARNHKRNLNRVWSGKVWRAKRLAFIDSRGSRCEWCGSTEGLTVHHPMRNSYGSSAYMDFYLSGCILLCQRCHSALHAGRVICDRDHADGEVHYRWHDAEMCSYCFLQLHPELKEQKKKDEERARRKKAQTKQAKAHPCKYRGLEQKCRRRSGEICTYNAKRAPAKCKFFKAKAGVKVEEEKDVVVKDA